MTSITISKTALLLLALLSLFLAENEKGFAYANDETEVYIVYMGGTPHENHELITLSHQELLASVVGREATRESMIYSYRHGFSGMAAKLSTTQAKKIAEMPGVLQVFRDELYSLKTTRTWDYLGLSSSSSSPSNLAHSANMGDGMVVGIIDTGLDSQAVPKYFNDEGLGPVPSRWKGICESGPGFDAGVGCNRKVIGARFFVDGVKAKIIKNNVTENAAGLSAVDEHGHGTHVAATAAGSIVVGESLNGLGSGVARGGAPKARIAVYKVFWVVNGGLVASAADLLQAFDAGIQDGVDVFCASLGSTVPIMPESHLEFAPSGISIGALHAVAKGIPVVAAAGNDGPIAQSVVNTAPWMITVGASRIDRAFPTVITLGNNKTILGQALYTGEATGFTELVCPTLGQTRGSERINCACNRQSLANVSLAGKVALCFMSDYGRDIPSVIDAVQNARAKTVIFAASPADSVMESNENMTKIYVDFEQGTQILFYMRSVSSPVVNISPSKTVTGKPLATKVAYFSARGPNSRYSEILKPDVVAPGVHVLAAGKLMSGTSMAAPHVAGIVALLRSQHPDWSPAAIRSALVTTASKTDPSGNPIFSEATSPSIADAFDYGGGLVNANKATNPGLVYDMGINDYVQFLCALGFSDSSVAGFLKVAEVEPMACPPTRPSLLYLNLPSITVPTLNKPIKVVRRVTNVGPPNSTYKAEIDQPEGFTIKVSPDVLVFDANTKTIPFEVEVSTTYEANTGYYFGSLTWSDGEHVVTIPVTLRAMFSGDLYDA